MKSLGEAVASLKAAANATSAAPAERHRVMAARLTTDLDLLTRDHKALYQHPTEEPPAMSEAWRRIEWDCPRECAECGSDEVRVSRTMELGGQKVRQMLCISCGAAFRKIVRILNDRQRQIFATDTLEENEE